MHAEEAWYQAAWAEPTSKFQRNGDNNASNPITHQPAQALPLGIAEETRHPPAWDNGNCSPQDQPASFRQQQENWPHGTTPNGYYWQPSAPTTTLVQPRNPSEDCFLSEQGRMIQGSTIPPNYQCFPQQINLSHCKMSTPFHRNPIQSQPIYC